MNNENIKNIELLIKTAISIIDGVNSNSESRTHNYLDATIRSKLVDIIPQASMFDMGIKQSVVELTDVLRNFEVKVDDDTIGGLKSIFGNIKVDHSLGVPGFKTAIDSMFGNDPNKGDNGKRSLDDLNWKSLIILFAGILVVSFDTNVKNYRSVIIIALLILNYDNILILGNAAIEAIIQCFSRINEDESEEIRMDDVEPQLYIEDATHAIIGILTGVATASLDKPVTAKDMFGAAATYDRSKRGIEGITTYLIELIERFINFMAPHFGFDNVQLLPVKDGSIQHFLDRVATVVNKRNTGTLHLTASNHDEIILLIEEGKKLLIAPSAYKDSAAIRYLQQELNILTNIEKEFSIAKVNSAGPRVEPVCVLLQGGPGTSKSLILEHLNQALLAATLDDDDYKVAVENPDEFVFNRQHENKFWDGYRPRNVITMFDDFGQSRTLPGNADSEFMNLIRVVNCFATLLHPADMSQKGKLHFHSKFVTVTTNFARIEAPDLLSSDALNRRFTHRYIVVPKDEYCTVNTVKNDVYSRRFDYSKLPVVKLEDEHSTEATQLTPEMVNFYVADDNGQPTGVVYQWEQILVEILRSYDVNASRHKVNKYTYNATRDKYRYLKDRVVAQAKIDDIIEGKSAKYDTSFERYNELNYDQSWFSIYFNFQEFSFGRKTLPLIYGDSDLLNVGLQFICRNTTLPRILKTVPVKEKLLFLICLITRQHYEKMRATSDAVRLYKCMLCDECNCTIDCTTTGNIYPIQEFDAKFVFNSFVEGLKTFCTQTVPRWFTNLVNHMKDNKVLYLGIAMLAAALGIFRTQRVIPDVNYTKIYYTDGLPVSEQGGDYEAIQRNSKNLASRQLQGKYKNMQRIVPQATNSNDKNGIKQLIKIMDKSVYSMTLHYDGKESMLGHITFVKDRIALLPYHFMLFIDYSLSLNRDPDSYISLHRGGRNMPPIKIMSSDVMERIFGSPELRSRDMVFINFEGCGVPVHKDITDCFVTEGILHKIDINIPICLGATNTTGVSHVVYTSTAKAIDTPVQVSSKIIGAYELRSGYSYPIPTKKGDCGAIVYYNNPAIPKAKIMGIHIAGSNTVANAFSSAITSELLISELGDMGVTIKDTIELEETDKVVAQGQFDVLGTLNNAPQRNVRSKIRRSLLYDTYAKHTEAVCYLRNIKIGEDIIDPMDLALSKYNNTSVAVSIRDVDAAIASFKSMIFSESHVSVTPRLYTLQEALDGLEYDIDVGKIDSNTSAGYPFNTQGVHNIKHEYYHAANEDDKRKAYLVIERMVEDAIIDMQSGYRLSWIFTDALKDYRTTEEKVKKGKGRFFSGGSFIYLIIVKMYFGAFVNWVKKNTISNGFAVGVNPYSMDWDVLARKLSTFDEGQGMVGAGDFSGFDASEQAIILERQLDIIEEFYQGDALHKRIRSILWMEVYNSIHVKDGVVYAWCGSLPSGHYMTLIVNSIYSHLAFRLCWIFAGLNIMEYNNNTYLIVQGDDNVITVHPKYRDLFNELLMPTYMRRLGLVYTTELKEAATVAWRPLGEVEFLKRGFRFDHRLTRWLAPLRLAVILEFPMWTKQGSERDKIVADNVNTAGRELSLHHKSVYDYWFPRISRSFILNYPELQTRQDIFVDYYTMQSVVIEED